MPPKRTVSAPARDSDSYKQVNLAIPLQCELSTLLMKVSRRFGDCKRLCGKGHSLSILYHWVAATIFLFCIRDPYATHAERMQILEWVLLRDFSSTCFPFCNTNHVSAKKRKFRDAPPKQIYLRVFVPWSLSEVWHTIECCLYRHHVIRVGLDPYHGIE